MQEGIVKIALRSINMDFEINNFLSQLDGEYFWVVCEFK